MVLDHHGEMLPRRIERWTLRHCPRSQHAFHLEPEVIMEPPRRMFLDNEQTAIDTAARARRAERLGRPIRTALLVVGIERHFRLTFAFGDFCCGPAEWGCFRTSGKLRFPSGGAPSHGSTANRQRQYLIRPRVDSRRRLSRDLLQIGQLSSAACQGQKPYPAAHLLSCR